LNGFKAGQIPVKLIPGLDQVLFNFQKPDYLSLQVITAGLKFFQSLSMLAHLTVDD
jgi:hypothetical protein